MEQISKIRYKEVDIVKGIAILLVILGHSYCQYPIDLASSTNVEVRNFFMHCQMPLFFLASGFLFSMKDNWNLFAKKKLMRLLVPYVIFSVASQGLRFLASGFSHSGETPGIADSVLKIITGQTYWFLYALLLVMITARVVSNKWCRTMLVCAIVAVFLVYDLEAAAGFLLGKTLRFGIWFFIGIGLRDVYHIVSPVLKNVWLLIASLIIYCVLCIFEFNKFSLVYLAPMAGCCLFWSLSVVVAGKDSIVNNVLEHFGKYSLQYYLNHLLIMLGCYIAASKLPTDIPSLQLVFIFSMGVAISWVMLQIELHIPLLRKLSGLQ